MTPRPLPAGRIRLLVADIDGCFSRGGRFPFNMEVIRRAREYNALSRTDETVPALVFCTGRPLPYVQCLHQVTDSHLPSLAECGLVLWDPHTRLHSEHPHFTANLRRPWMELLRHVEEELIDPEAGILLEAGKFTQVTVFPNPPFTMEQLVERVQVFAQRWHEAFAVDYTHAVINFLPHGLHKGAGIEWLSKVTGIALDEMAGIGDAESDWDFLQHCGISASPSNGRPSVRSRVHWPLDSPAEISLIEMYETLIEFNRAR